MKDRSESEPTSGGRTHPTKPDRYRGFFVELAAEDRGEPVYPLWDDLKVDGNSIYIPRQHVEP